MDNNQFRTIAMCLRGVISSISFLFGKILNIFYCVALITIYQLIIMVCLLALSVSTDVVYITYFASFMVLVAFVILIFRKCNDYYDLKSEGDGLVDKLQYIIDEDSSEREEKNRISTKSANRLIIEYQSKIIELKKYVSRVKILVFGLLILSMFMAVLPILYL